MYRTRKFVFFVMVFCCLLSSFLRARADDVTMDAAVTMRAASTFSCSKKFDFGIIRYEDIHSGKINIGTNSNVDLGRNSKGLALAGGTPGAAEICIGADKSSTVEITCEAKGRISNRNNTSLEIKKIELSMNTGKKFGAGIACAGAKRVAVMDLSESGTQNLYFGGEITLAENSMKPLDPLDTLNSGSDPITVQFIYQ